MTCAAGDGFPGWEKEMGNVTEASECLVEKCVHYSIMNEKP